MYNKKQIKYVGLRGRITASLIDATLMIIVSIPFIQLLNLMLYGRNTPSILVEQVTQDLKNKADTTISPLAQFVTDPRIYDFFIIHHGLEKFIISNLLQLLAFTIIIILFWRRYQATPGKMLLSFKIVDATTMEKPSSKQLFLRYLGYFISFIPLFMGFFSIIFSKQKQGWHDKLANTIVIKK